MGSYYQDTTKFMKSITDMIQNSVENGRGVVSVGIRVKEKLPKSDEDLGATSQWHHLEVKEANDGKNQTSA